MSAAGSKSPDPDLTPAEVLRYSRHLSLPDVGRAGQRRLKAASALIVGAGGLGCPVALYLAAAGVGRIGLIDFDRVDASNLQRQILYAECDVGRLKTDAARTRLAEVNPHIEIVVHQESFSVANAARLVADHDLVIDGSDNFATRYLVNDACVLGGKPNVHGSVYRFEGSVSVFAADGGPCYRCLFPEPPTAGQVPSCAEGGILGVLPGTIGTLQATEALKLLLGRGEPLVGRLLHYDALATRFHLFTVPRDPGCPLCGDHPTIRTLTESDAGACAAPATARKESRSIRPAELATRLDAPDPPRLLDVRTDWEWELARLPGAVHIPLVDLEARLRELDPSREIVTYCRAGRSSRTAVHALEAAGFERVRDLRGGLDAWRAEIEPTFPAC